MTQAQRAHSKHIDDCDVFQADIASALGTNSAEHTTITEKLTAIAIDLKWMKWLPTLLGTIFIGLLLYIFKTHTHQ